MGRLSFKIGSWLGAAIVALSVMAPSLARAADYTEKRVGDYVEMAVDADTPRSWKKLSQTTQLSDIKSMLRGDSALDAPTFDAFFRKMFFPQYTFIAENVFIDAPDSKENRTSRLPKMRTDLIKLIDQAARNQVAFDFLNKLTGDAMTTIALGNYHPLARHSAALALGNLKDFSGGPSPDAVPLLIRCLGSSDLVKVAALSGLTAHVKAGVADKDKPALLAALEKLVDDKASHAAESPEGRMWIRRHAIELFAAMKDPGPKSIVVSTLIGVLKDSQSSIPVSCAAARALGGFDIRRVDSQEFAALAASIGQTGVDACRAELARAAEQAAAAPLPIARGGSNAGSGPVSRGPNGDIRVAARAVSAGPQYIVTAELKSQLQSLELGLKGNGGGLIAATKGGPLEPTVAAIDKGLLGLIAACDAADAPYESLKQQITRGADALEAAVGRSGEKGRAPAAGKGGDADGFGDATETPAKPPVNKIVPKPAPAKIDAAKPAAG